MQHARLRISSGHIWQVGYSLLLMVRRGRFCETHVQWVLDTLANHLAARSINRATPAINQINPLRRSTLAQIPIVFSTRYSSAPSTINMAMLNVDITTPGHSSRRFVHGNLVRRKSIQEGTTRSLRANQTVVPS